MTNIYDNTPDEGVIASILAIEAEAAEVKSRLTMAKNVLVERKAADIAEALKQKKEPFGAVSQNIGDKKVTFTTPKKVEWSQDGLKALWNQMIADGADPSEYIVVDYTVKEDAYKNWPTNLKEYFEPHRTVTPGNIAVKIDDAKAK